MNTMKPSVIANSPKTTANDVETAGGGVGRQAFAANGSKAAPNGITIPINHEYTSTPSNYYNAGEAQPSYKTIPQQQQPPTQHHQQSKDHQIPGNIQSSYGFEPDMDMGMDMGMDADMFPHNRFDPFHGFARNSRKRGSLHNPHFQTDGFSRFDFDDDPDFGFPQFNSLSRRHNNVADDPADDDLFHRLSSEFRQYMPDNFGHRRAPFAYAPSSNSATPMATPTGMNPMAASQSYNTSTIPMTNMRKFCDAAIQTDGAAGNASETDPSHPSEKLHHHGFRNTVDMGVKTSPEGDMHASRSHSMPPRENQLPVSAKSTSPPLGSANNFMNQAPQHKSSYFAPQPDNPAKSDTPQTPSGSVVRTIPIFVEGRSEPIINDKEIPTPAATATQTQSAEPGKFAATTARKCFPTQQKQQQQQQQQQQQRPPPLNTQRRQQTASEAEMANSNLPPQTPQTMDSINKIQDIQHDVLELMSNVEKFTGTRSDKDYVYLDEMLTRNLLKLDNIDTNGKESIRLARKEAIKCIQASINVLEAKAEENSRKMQTQSPSQTPNPDLTTGTKENQQASQQETSTEVANAGAVSDNLQQSNALSDKSNTPNNTTTTNTNTTESNEEKESTAVTPATEAKGDNNEEKSNNKIQEPIPLPAPEGMTLDVKQSDSIKQETADHQQQQQPQSLQEPTVVNNKDNKENENQQRKEDITCDTKAQMQAQIQEERKINPEKEKETITVIDTVKEATAEAERKTDDTTQSNPKDELNDKESKSLKP